MRGGARVLPGARCFRGAARRFLVWAAAVCATFRRRSRSARFAAVFCGSHSACRALHRVLRRSFRVPDFAPDFYAGRAPELLIFL